MDTRMTKDLLENALDDEISSGEKVYGPDFKLRIVKILSLYGLLHPEGEHKESRRIPLSEWNNYHDYPSVGTMYQWNAKASENGFDMCVERGGSNGGRTVIVEDKFWQWHSNRKKGA